MIRPIQDFDLNALLTLCAEHADYEQLPFNMADQQARWKSLFFGQPPKIFVWIYEQDNDLQGYMSATIDYATWTAQPFVYMDCLYLRASCRGRGIGRRFMNTLQSFARKNCCDEIQWHTPPHNRTGIDFYRHIGADEKPKMRYFLTTTREDL